MKQPIKLQKWRLAVLLVLYALPLVFLMALGGWHLWETGWLFIATWPMLACFAVAAYLAWFWQARKRLLSMQFDPEMHWTDRDKVAWKKVEERANSVEKIEAEQLADMNFYTNTAKDMALQLAQVYNPEAKDPISSLTIPEILAVIELAAHDLGTMVAQYLPAGHLLTINDWKNAQRATKWYKTASNVYWAVSAIFAPYKTAVRWVASQAGIGKPWQFLQQNLLLWFYTAFIHRMGTYLIELNSGRLRVGAERYRKLVAQMDGVDDGRPATASPYMTSESDGDSGVPQHVTLTIMGQVKAGKSSLVNALIGDAKATTSVLPATDAVTAYDMERQESKHRLQVLDTVGYGHEGPNEDQLKQTQTAAQQSDLLLLVLHANTPSRQADVNMLTQLTEWFGERKDLKMPRILAVVTHIDLLRPPMEWDPPYNWQKPSRPKEQNIEAAIAAVREQLGQYLVGAIPVCAAEGKVYGVQEELVPAIATLLEEGRAVAMLRCLHTEANEGKFRKVLSQTFAGGKELAKVLWQQLKS